MSAVDTLDEGLRALFSGDPDLCADPYALYDRLREESPVHGFGGSLLAVSHEAAKQAYRRNDVFKCSRGRGRFAESVRLLSEEELDLLDEVTEFEKLYMSSLNGEVHRRVRSAAQRAFTPKRLEELETVAREVTEERLDRLAREETPDLIELCYLVPLLVIGDMLGAPREDAPLLKRLGDEINAHKHFSPVRPESVRVARRAVDEFREYALGLIERNRANDDRTALATALLDANEDDRLSIDELVSTMVLILFAGHETTTNLLGNGIFALQREREQWELLCADPTLVASAVEECFRIESPVQGMGRVADVDTELCGVEVPEGTRIRMMNGAANRDPSVFADPARMDITRRPNDHVALGMGLHFCLGGPLARVEGRVVLDTIVRRFPELELAVPIDELEWRADPQLRGLVHLPVRLGRDRG